MRFPRIQFRASDPFITPGLRLRFPVGPEYVSLVASGAKNGRPWVEFKLQAASWYLTALEELYARDGDLHRLVGEEMALDGFLASASSAFDAAVAGLIRAIETSQATPTSAAIPARRMSWPRAKDLAANPPPVALGCENNVDGALDGMNTDSPIGWLAQLRHLRNRATHEDTLARTFFVPHQPCEIKVPGLGNVLPIPYLRSVLPPLRALCEEILRDADHLNP